LDPVNLGISEGKTMVVGIDVTHLSPGSKDTAPNVAGIVVSVDKYLGQWLSDFRIQESRKETISDVKGMFLSRLTLWEKRNKSLPDCQDLSGSYIRCWVSHDLSAIYIFHCAHYSLYIEGIIVIINQLIPPLHWFNITTDCSLY
jgi:hypothetical protein